MIESRARWVAAWIGAGLLAAAHANGAAGAVAVSPGAGAGAGLAEFRRVRQAFVALIAHADDTALARTALHPRLRTPMSLTDLAFFVAEHDDHHLAAIAALIDPPAR